MQFHPLYSDCTASNPRHATMFFTVDNKYDFRSDILLYVKFVKIFQM